MMIDKSIKRSLNDSIPEDIKLLGNDDIIQYLFDNNKLLTTDNAELAQSDDLKNILAYFQDGSIVISQTHRFDGRVLSFQALVDRKRLKVKEPYYGDLGLIANIYKHDDSSKEIFNKKGDKFDNKMQRDLVDIVSRAANSRVSDIHVIVAEQTSIYFRADGDMKLILQYDNLWGESFLRSVFASADLSDSNYAQNDFQSAQKLGSTPLRGSKDLFLPKNISALRLQFNPIAFGSKYLVMRLLYLEKQTVVKDLSSLGFSQYEENIFKRMRRYPHGLCIVGGPTGSGKSNTLRQNMIMMLQEADYTINLITIEDPVETLIAGSRQLPVTNAMDEKEKDEHFTKALASSLRSDPDSIMVGEIRTMAAANLSIQGALSGHNVWTTIHANSAIGILSRMLDMGVQDFKLQDESLIRALMSQRLYKRLCQHCKKPLAKLVESEEYKRLVKVLGTHAVEQIFLQGEGCSQCGFKGTQGRIAVIEMITPNAEFLTLVGQNKFAEATSLWVNKLGGRTIKEASISIMLQGIVGINEIERWCGLLDEDIIL